MSQGLWELNGTCTAYEAGNDDTLTPSLMVDTSPGLQMIRQRVLASKRPVLTCCSTDLVQKRIVAYIFNLFNKFKLLLVKATVR
jgi:hypothetical protein